MSPVIVPRFRRAPTPAPWALWRPTKRAAHPTLADAGLERYRSALDRYEAAKARARDVRGALARGEHVDALVGAEALMAEATPAPEIDSGTLAVMGEQVHLFFARLSSLDTRTAPVEPGRVPLQTRRTRLGNRVEHFRFRERWTAWISTGKPGPAGLSLYAEFKELNVELEHLIGAILETQAAVAAEQEGE